MSIFVASWVCLGSPIVTKYLFFIIVCLLFISHFVIAVLIVVAVVVILLLLRIFVRPPIFIAVIYFKFYVCEYFCQQLRSNSNLVAGIASIQDRLQDVFWEGVESSLQHSSLLHEVCQEF